MSSRNCRATDCGSREQLRHTFIQGELKVQADPEGIGMGPNSCASEGGEVLKECHSICSIHGSSAIGQKSQGGKKVCERVS